MNSAGSYPSLPAAVKRPVPRSATLWAAAWLAGFLIQSTAYPAGAPLRAREVMLPMTCAELLPEAEAFRNFFEAVARGAVTTNARLSKRMFRVLALRGKLSESDKVGREENPIDTLIRKTMCFYRESKDPLRAVPFDDPEFMKYLSQSIDEVERKSDDAIYQAELDRMQREEYEKRLDRNRNLIEQLRLEGERSAEKSFEQLSKKARRKVDHP